MSAAHDLGAVPDMMRVALDLAARGFTPVLLHEPGTSNGCTCYLGKECGSPGKHPRFDDWPNQSTRAVGIIGAMWKRFPTANVGIVCGGEDGLVVFDVDGPTGFASLVQLESENAPLPDTMRVRTGRAEGGEHWYFRATRDQLATLRSSQSRIGPKLDVKAGGGQVVAPGSLHHTGLRYAVVDRDAPIAPWPEWLHKLATRDAAEKPLPEPSPDPERAAALHRFASHPGRPHALDRFKAYVEKTPGAVSQQHGHNATLRIAAVGVKGFLLDPQTVYAVLAGQWNPTCSPPWSAKELRHKVSEAGKYRDIQWAQHLGEVRPMADRPPPAKVRPPGGARATPPSRDDDAAEREAIEGEAPASSPGFSGEPANDDAGNGPASGPVRSAPAGGTKGGDDRPTIIVYPGEINTAVDAAISVLTKNPHLNLYARDGKIVNVSECREESSKDSPFQKGTPRIYALCDAGLAERLCVVARWCRPGKRTKKGQGPPESTDPPGIVRAAVLAKGRADGALPGLIGIVETPTMRADGSILSAPGYDGQTGYYMASAERWPAVPENPTRDDARAALALLEDIFIDFPWESPGGKSVAIAAALTIIARPAIVGPVPAFIFDANSPGFGKSLVADVIAYIATGRDAAKMTYPSSSDGSDAEVAKILAGTALGGARILLWDDLCPENPFGGSALQGTLTAGDTKTFRILGKSETPELPWRTVMLATGNNVSITRDMERRVYIARIVALWSDPSRRPLGDYKHPERKGRLCQYVLDNRKSLVLAALTILRAYHLAGRPDGLDHDTFEPWARLIPSAIQWAGGASTNAHRPTETGQVSPERAAVQMICQHWRSLDPACSTEGITVQKAIDLLYCQDRKKGAKFPPDAELDPLREAIEILAPFRLIEGPNRNKLGMALKKVNQQVHAIDGGMARIEAVPAKRGGNTWRVVPAKVDGAVGHA